MVVVGEDFFFFTDLLYDVRSETNFSRLAYSISEGRI